MHHIVKNFPGVLALDNVELNVKRGVVHAVVGENGAGKSTLMKVIMGMHQPDSGEIRINGEAVVLKNPLQSIQMGISMIHQELSNVGDLTVAQNMFLGREIMKKGGVVDRKAMETACQEVLAQLGLNIEAGQKMKTLSMARQQMCEIAKAVSNNAQIIIMDEPTSAITETEVEALFTMIRKLVKQNTTILYISHKLDEIYQITDYVSVYRDGKYIGTRKTCEVNRNELIKMMVGRELTALYPKEESEIGEVLLKVENLSREGEFSNISFEVHRGEILGVAGLMGAGRSEVMETVFGVRKKDSGRIFIKGEEVDIHSPRDAIQHGMGLLTEDRKQSGCFLTHSVALNIYIAAAKQFCKGPVLDKRKAMRAARRMQQELRVKTPSMEQKMENLSGGNQQKALVARWLLTDPDILVVDEPTRGIDAGSKSEIYALLSALAKAGKAIIMVSSEMPEILGMSDRVMVMSQGCLSGFLDRSEATQENIMQYAVQDVD